MQKILVDSRFSDSALGDDMYSFDNYFIDCVVKIAVSFVCGLVLGIERKRRFHSVGIRTLVLISVASTLMGIISYEMAQRFNVSGDPTRIAAGVVTGIGFIGGGAIMHQGMNIKGLTSAAIIWAACALGLACSIGAYFVVGLTLLLSLSSLVLLGMIEGRFFPAEKSKNLILVYSGSNVDLEKIKKAKSDACFIQRDMDITESLETSETILRFTIKTPREYSLADLTSRIKDTGNLKKISITEN